MRAIAESALTGQHEPKVIHIISLPEICQNPIYSPEYSVLNAFLKNRQKNAPKYRIMYRSKWPVFRPHGASAVDKSTPASVFQKSRFQGISPNSRDKEIYQCFQSTTQILPIISPGSVTRRFWRISFFKRFDQLRALGPVGVHGDINAEPFQQPLFARNHQPRGPVPLFTQPFAIVFRFKDQRHSVMNH